MGKRARTRATSPERAPEPRRRAGTSGARRSRVGRLHRRQRPGGDQGRVDDEQPQREAGPICGWEPGRVDEARVDRQHRDATLGQLDRDRAREGKLGMLGGRVGADREGAATETTLTTRAPGWRPSRNARRHQTEPR